MKKLFYKSERDGNSYRVIPEGAAVVSNGVPMLARNLKPGDTFGWYSEKEDCTLICPAKTFIVSVEVPATYSEDRACELVNTALKSTYEGMKIVGCQEKKEEPLKPYTTEELRKKGYL